MRARVSLATKIVYGVGDVANSIRAVLNGLFLFFFYTSVIGLPGSLVGATSGVVLIWDAVIDPVIGHLSDRLNPGLGRRHGFMLIGALATAVTTWALFSPPRGAPTEVVVTWFFVATALSRVAGALFQIPYYALGAEMSANYHDRTVVTGIRGIWALVASLATASVSLVVFFPNTTGAEDPKLNYAGYPNMGLAFGVLAGLTAVVATVGTLRLRAHLNVAPIPSLASPAAPLAAFWKAARVAFGRRSFRTLFVSFALIYLGTVINSALSLHYFTYYTGMVSSADLSIVRGSFYVGALVGIPLWVASSRRLQKQHAYLVGSMGTVLIMVLGFAVVGTGHLFGTGDARPLIAGQIIAGLTASVLWIIPASMLADIADEDALESGTYRQGIFFGLVSLGQKLLTGLSLLLSGVLIDGFAGLVAGQAEQSPLTIERIGILACLLPALLLTAGTALIFAYPLNRARMAAVEAKLSARRNLSPHGDDAGAIMPRLVVERS